MRIIMPARIIAVLVALLLAACTTFSPDGGMNVTADIADRELHKNTQEYDRDPQPR
jgi:hypothetical protein